MKTQANIIFRVLEKKNENGVTLFAYKYKILKVYFMFLINM